MRTLILLLSFLCLSYSYSQEKLTPEEKAKRERNIQAGNPFKKFGYKPKISTLSKGKYLEFHDLDSIVKIGSFTFHVKNKTITGYTQVETKYSEATLRPELVSRWFSPDPLSAEFPEWSPYNFVMNNPIRYIDPTGLAPEDIIDKDGNKLDIKIVDNQLVYGDNVSQDVQNVLNGMWQTESGQSQVSHLLNTKSQVYVNVSDDVGVVYYEGKYYGAYGLTGPSEGQSTKMVKDYDGGKVYEENTLTLYKGTYEYGIGDTSALDNGKVSVTDLDGNDLTSSHKNKVKLEPSQNPDKLYKTATQFYNLAGVHETEHTKSGNIKLQRRGQDAEAPAYKIEAKSRKQLKKN